jgi:uncharacterized repeat protein (TIGR02543 family)
LSNTTVANNTATTFGGGITNGGNITLTNTTIANNTAYVGGGIYDNGDNSILSNTTITNNTAKYYGGGIVNHSNLTISNTTLANNTAIWGGGIDNYGNITLSSTTVANNTATWGGGIYLSSGFVELFSGTIANNSAVVDGGGVWVAHADLNRLFVYDGMIFSNNRASVAYNRNPADDAIYYAQIGSNVVWTTPFTQGYNNYDISYTNGTPYVFSYNVTVNNSYASVTGAGTYQEGEIVTINAGTRPGYTFTNWTINEGNITLTLPNTPTATFIMPESDVTVTANWQADQSQTGSFSVTKLTDPPDTAVDFNFITSVGASFSLTEGGDSWFSGEIPVGVYTVTELPKAGWELVNVQVEGTTNYTLNLNTNTLTFTL